MLGAGGLACGVGAYARFVEPHWVEQVDVVLPIRGLGRGLDGYRIAHISDLHTGPEVSVAYLRESMDRVRSLGADLIVVTGDFITGGLGDQIQQVGALLARLESRDGLLACLGNHDYHSWVPDKVRLDVASRLCEVVQQTGGRVLRNECATISRDDAVLTVVGLDDLFVARCRPDEAYARVQRDAPILALAHNPDSMDLLDGYPADAVLAGHTHGGQVIIPGLGPPRLPVRHVEYASGLIRVGEKLLYVTRGVGHVLKVRLFCRPEITVHTLRAVPA